VLEFNHAHHASLTSLLNVIAQLKYVPDGHAHVFHILIIPVVTVGNVVSLFILYVADVAPVPHTSNILMTNGVVAFAAGVNAGVVNDVDTVSLQLVHPSIEYCTFVLADGVAVSVAVHVIVHA
jgi:hypothetical protein